MSFLAATAVAMRIAIILIACAMIVGLRRELWAVVRKKPGWAVYLTTTAFVTLVFAEAVISSVNMFPDAGWPITESLRLIVVNAGLLLFLIGTLTGLYRRALRSGPDKARGAFISGTALLIPGMGLVLLLTVSGANG